MPSFSKLTLVALLVGCNITLLLLLPRLPMAEAKTRKKRVKVTYVTNAQLADVMKTMTALRADLEKTKKELSDSKARVKDMSFRLPATRAVAPKTDETGAALKAKLTEEITARQADTAALEAEVRERKQDRTALDAEINARRGDKVSLESEITKLTELKGGLESEIAARKADRSALETEIQARKELLATVSDLTRQVKLHTEILNGNVSINLLKVRNLHLYDDAGSQRALLSTGKDGKPALWLYDKDGTDMSTYGESIYLKLRSEKK